MLLFVITFVGCRIGCRRMSRWRKEYESLVWKNIVSCEHICSFLLWWMQFLIVIYWHFILIWLLWSSEVKTRISWKCKKKLHYLARSIVNTWEFIPGKFTGSDYKELKHFSYKNGFVKEEEKKNSFWCLDWCKGFLRETVEM